MSVLLLWVVSPAEITSGLGFSDSIRGGGMFSDSSRSLSGATNSRCSWKLQGRKPKWSSCSLNTDMTYGCLGFEPENSRKFPVFSSLVANPAGEIGITSEQKVYDVVLKQAALVKDRPRSNRVIDLKPDVVIPGTLHLLNEAYDRCGEVCAEYAKTFYLGTMLMTPERRRAIWAIYGKRLIFIGATTIGLEYARFRELRIIPQYFISIMNRKLRHWRFMVHVGNGKLETAIQTECEE